MYESEVTNCWIEKQHMKDKYRVCIYDENSSEGNAYIYFTFEQLKKLKKDIERRIKKYGVKPLS